MSLWIPRNKSSRYRKQSLQVTVYLIAVTLPAFFLGYFLLGYANRMVFLLAVALIGFSGSGVAALTSCLDRYAKGFELEDGTKVPAEAKGETFNRRMLRWFYVRPFLGFLVGPVTIWGIEFLVKDANAFRDTTATSRLFGVSGRPACQINSRLDQRAL